MVQASCIQYQAHILQYSTNQVKSYYLLMFSAFGLITILRFSIELTLSIFDCLIELSSSLLLHPPSSPSSFIFPLVVEYFPISLSIFKHQARKNINTTSFSSSWELHQEATGQPALVQFTILVNWNREGPSPSLSLSSWTQLGAYHASQRQLSREKHL